MKISRRGIDLIKRFEGLRLTGYLDAVGVPTVGYGHVRTAGIGQVITVDEAEALLRADLYQFETGVERMLIRQVKPSQFDALVCFAFNFGLDLDTDTRAESLRDSHF